jgi:hypothetical protein
MIRFIFGIASLVGKFVMIMGVGVVLLSKPFFVDDDSHFQVIRSREHVYQVNYEKDKIDSVEIFDREGNYKGEFKYSELKGNHRKVIDGVKK